VILTNFIVASVGIGTKSGFVRQMCTGNHPARAREKLYATGRPRLTSNNQRVRMPVPPYGHVPRSSFFATMLSVLQKL
jgi:hypothetical protein